MTLVIHILAGSLALLCGYVALFSRKGGTLHRGFGRWFVYAMLTMSTAALVIVAMQGVAPSINVPMALLAAYLVVTSWMTVRPSDARFRSWHLLAAVFAAGIALADFGFGLDALARGGTIDGIPAFPFFLFGIIALLASIGDLKLVRAGALQGAPRLARHLWRMCLSLAIAALAFFIGQSDEFPAALRIPPLLALPMLIALGAMTYWLRRVRIRKSAQPRAV